MFIKSYLSHVVFVFHIMSYLMMLQKSGFFVLSRRYRQVVQRIELSIGSSSR